MYRRIVIINGSLRANGDTDVIIKSFLDGAESTGAIIKQYVLRDKNINDNTSGVTKKIDR